jgi:hypothetical protein
VLEEKHHYKLELSLGQLVDQGILLAGEQKWMVVDKMLNGKVVAKISILD